MRIVIFANGQPPTPEQVRGLVRPDDFIVCADGGANFAAQIGITPQVVIGDFDSINPELQASLTRQGVEFIAYPRDKDQTDLELALEYSLARGCTELLLIAALGGRLDHLLTNVHLLSDPRFSQIAISLVDHDAPGQLAYIVHGPTELSWHGAKGQEVSLIPLSAQVEGVTLTGTRWPLDLARLEKGNSLTVSNRMVTSVGQLKIMAGTLLALLPITAQRD